MFYKIQCFVDNLSNLYQKLHMLCFYDYYNIYYNNHKKLNRLQVKSNFENILYYINLDIIQICAIIVINLFHKHFIFFSHFLNK